MPTSRSSRWVDLLSDTVADLRFTVETGAHSSWGDNPALSPYRSYDSMWIVPIRDALQYELDQNITSPSRSSSNLDVL